MGEDAIAAGAVRIGDESHHKETTSAGLEEGEGATETSTEGMDLGPTGSPGVEKSKS